MLNGLTLSENSHFFKCIYYRAYCMAEIIPHKMFVTALQLACNSLHVLVYGGLAIFRSMSSTQENWKHYHLLTHYRSRIINTCNGKKITMFKSNIFSSVCIDEYILIPSRYLIFISKI